MVPGCFILIGGDPGIGKSTLLLQMAKGLLDKEPPHESKILYVSGEESVEQITMRAKRLGMRQSSQMFLANQTRLEVILATVQEMKPKILIMDSLQTFASDALESPPGSVSQVREVALRLMQMAKQSGITVWLVGHVTKEGSIAGPKWSNTWWILFYILKVTPTIIIVCCGP